MIPRGRGALGRIGFLSLLCGRALDAALVQAQQSREPGSLVFGHRGRGRRDLLYPLLDSRGRQVSGHGQGARRFGVSRCRLVGTLVHRCGSHGGDDCANLGRSRIAIFADDLVEYRVAAVTVDRCGASPLLCRTAIPRIAGPALRHDSPRDEAERLVA